MQFGISVPNVHRVIHRLIPLLHAMLVKKFIKWPSNHKWINLSGYYSHWPRVVAILDGTPFRISKPTGRYIIISILQRNITFRCIFLPIGVRQLPRVLWHPGTPSWRQQWIFYQNKHFEMLHQFNCIYFIAGQIQHLFWRRDWHCFFLNWIIIVDVKRFCSVK